MTGLHWGLFFEEAPFGGVKYYQWIIDGFWVTTRLFVYSWILAFFAGSLFGILRTVPSRFCRAIGTAYVELFRNIPLIAQFFLWYLVAPELLPAQTGAWFKRIDPDVQFMITAVVCLGLFTGGRVCEQVRSGILALSSGQAAAGLALGMTWFQTYCRVIMPNAYRIILPPMTSEMLNLIKNSAVASTIGLVELSAQANRMLEFSARSYESFIAVTAAYVVLNFVVMGAMRVVERVVSVPGTAARGKRHA